MNMSGTNHEREHRLQAQRDVLLKVLNEFPMLLSPAKTAWGRKVQDWQDNARAVIAQVEAEEA